MSSEPSNRVNGSTSSRFSTESNNRFQGGEAKQNRFSTSSTSSTTKMRDSNNKYSNDPPSRRVSGEYGNRFSSSDSNGANRSRYSGSDDQFSTSYLNNNISSPTVDRRIFPDRQK